MANETPLKPPKGFKSWKVWTGEVSKLLHANRPIDGPGTAVNEMPDGRQIVAKPAAATGSPIEVAMAVWPGPVTKLVQIRHFGIRAVPEVEE